jgi:hypothetical protein
VLPNDRAAHGVLWAGRVWHRECLRCQTCHKFLARRSGRGLGHEFSGAWLDGNRTEPALLHDAAPLCAQCFLRAGAARCALCGATPSAVALGRRAGAFELAPTGDVFCARHAGGGVRPCASCAAPRAAPAPGRACAACAASAVRGSAALDALALRVADDLEEATGVALGSPPPPLPFVLIGHAASFTPY